MTEMIKRVAIAISSAPFPSPNSLRKAKLAIEEMRDPTGLTCMHGITMSERPSHTCVCHTAFMVLIDEATSEKGQ